MLVSSVIALAMSHSTLVTTELNSTVGLSNMVIYQKLCLCFVYSPGTPLVPPLILALHCWFSNIFNFIVIVIIIFKNSPEFCYKTMLNFLM